METTFQAEGMTKASWWGWDHAWSFGSGARKTVEAVFWRAGGRKSGGGWRFQLVFCVKWGVLAAV